MSRERVTDLPHVPFSPNGLSEPHAIREGLDLALSWPDGVRFTLTSIRDGRDGVRGELTVTHGDRRLHWGALALSSTAAREALRKKLKDRASGVPWNDYLEDGCWRLTQAAREGEPLVALTGRVTSPTRELLPRLLYEGEPTLLYADGDTGKSLVALALAVAVHGGAALPFGLKPARPAPAAFLDWETSRDTLEARLALLAAGLGIDPPPILYKRMTRPLVDEAAALAAEFARASIGFVVIDSKMFAVAGGDGAAFHEPITAFYNALRLFAPAASLILNHVTGADARGGGPSRPFGGAFAFNGPRLIWEAKRDHEVTDATAIAFTCRKANNLPRKPEPFGLRFVPGVETITVYPFDLTEASPTVVAGASVTYRIQLALAQGHATVDAIAEHLGGRRERRGRSCFLAGAGASGSTRGSRREGCLMAPAGRLGDGLLKLFPDGRARVAQEYRRCFEGLVTDLGLDAGHLLRDEAARAAGLVIRARVAGRAWGLAVEQRRVGRGRRPSERRVERLARRAALDDLAASHALDRLRELATKRNGHRVPTPTEVLEQMTGDGRG